MTEKHRIYGRIGRFQVPAARVWRCGDEFVAMMQRVIVLKCDFAPWADAFEYVAAAPDFKDLGTGTGYNAPTYHPKFEQQADGTELFKGFA
jgi:hypothetical protein